MRKFAFYPLLGLLFIPVIISAQSLREPISAIYLGLSAYSTQHTDVFSFTNNQAALAQQKDVSVGVYGERRFMLQETSVYTAAAAFATSKGNFGIDLKYAGFSDYNENQLGVAYARSLGKNLDVGIQFNYYGYSITSYGSNSAINFEAGAIAHLTDQLNAGIHIYNPVGGSFSKGDEKLTSAYSFGLGYEPSNQFYISMEAVKEEGYPINVNSGVQYQFDKIFFARAGISSGTSSYYAGAGVGWSNYRLDVSCSFHPQLGLSPGLLFIANFGKKKDEKGL
ncbi:PorV/PorQ family protein [Ferruginibacter albus]|uniref:hypothetical protein n=1 Tax=Ferruginibacter albus TaxID=2875540 RepID=UPI001CC7C293|nr:hypothetical protein [Ferruginibacter albus]UAY51738.1 hypothetical protein K9M53_14220 [Ferruginibacter albus]